MSTTTKLPPSPNHLTTDQIDQLYTTLFDSSIVTATSNDKKATQQQSPPPSFKGRSVLIPFSKQGFILGELDPSIDEATGDEQVRIVTGNGNEIQTISTKRAKEWLHENSSFASTDTATGAAAAATLAANTKKNSQSSTPLPPKSNVPKAAVPPQPMSSPFGLGGGFVEIQEEFNSDGQQVRGDVFDVSQRLNAIWKNANEPIPEPVNINNTTNTTTPTAATASTTTTTTDAANDEIINEKPEPKKEPISDEAYEKLSQRLEELARLEEEAELEAQNPRRVVKPKKQLTGSGWKKGFLSGSNNQKKKKKKQPQPQPNSVPVPVPVPKSNDTTPASKPSGGGKGVKFDTSQNQVQEIPRIGTQKVPPKPTAASKQGIVDMFPDMYQAQSNSSSGAPVERKPLESSMFSGIIQERPTTTIKERPLPTKKKINVIKERPIIQERSPMQQQKQKQQQQSKPKKKMSRFAQERNQQR